MKSQNLIKILCSVPPSDVPILNADLHWRVGYRQRLVGRLLLIPLLIVVQKGIIEREEAYLTRQFGDDYLSYKIRVRRWL